MSFRAALTLLLAAATLQAAAQDGSLDELIARARKRDAEAEYTLGMRAYEGRGVPRDASQAFRLIERAAKRGHLEAQNALGFFLQHGIGTAADAARAREWYETAAARDHARAQVNLGWLYENGLGVERSPALALEWYHKAAAQGVSEGDFNAASLLEAGAPPDLAGAAAAYERAAQKNFAPANYRLGLLLEHHRVPVAAYGGALDRYEAAARAGLPEAQVAAARLLLAAGGTAKARAALGWIDEAAKKKFPAAQALLDDAGTQFRLASLLEPAESIAWLRKAAAQGHRDAQLQLAIALAEGRGTAAAPAEAASWYEKAGDAGNGEALYRLALLFDDGIGVPRDTVKARDLIGQAAALGHDQANEQLNRLLGLGPPPLNGDDPFKRMR